MKIAILDYCTDSVILIPNAPLMDDNRDVEEYLSIQGYKMSQVSYMYGNFQTIIL